jgi:hypothetical protein
MTKIRVNPSNSKVLAGKLFITELKALLVSKSKVLAELIEYDNNIVFKGTKLVEYNGPYIRLKK